MVNLTRDGLIFSASDDVLDVEVRKALRLVSDLNLTTSGLQPFELSTVTTKRNLRAAFAKFVDGHVLGQPGLKFDRTYVECAFDAYRQKVGHLTKDHFDKVMAADADPESQFSYRASYAVSIKPYLGAFLIALHSSGAITLPASFRWPSLRQEGRQRLEIGGSLSSELLAFIRTLDTQSDALPHPAFQAIDGDKKRREWFLAYATKLLLATGWHKPEDVNVDDLLSIKAAEKEISGKDEVALAYSALINVVNLAFPGRVRITSADWSKAARGRLSSAKTGEQSTHVANALNKLFGDQQRSDHDFLDDALRLTALWGHPDRLKTVDRLPGLDAEVGSLSKVWLELQQLFLRKTSRENYKNLRGALGWWNVYLFFYLLHWFDRNRESALEFPSSPSLVLKSVFISRLLPTDEERPVTFIEFMNLQAERKEWEGNTYYAILLQLQGFFEFIERYADEMPGCEGFKQPLAPHDYPRTSRSHATKKQPVPRRLFGVYLDYYEALIAHHGVVTNRVLEGKLSADGMRQLESNGNVIDTIATADLAGFVPMIFTRTRSIRLQFIPNVLDARQRTVRGLPTPGESDPEEAPEATERTPQANRLLMLPHPHCLHQNLAALHTGVRHNHLQWLDKDKFDSLVDEDDTEFALLYVNTDKQKKEPWTPHVNFRVIELLRAQREWCELIDEPAFHREHFYNDNKNTKWPKFRPLFAHASNGMPHHDNRYTDVWVAMLCGLQGLMAELPELGRGRRLLTLLPPGFQPGDAGLAKSLAEYGAQFQMGQFCPLRVTTPITPHSARVAVVSQYITFLPTDLIGKHITGQHPGVVPYYVHLDQETIEAAQVHQAARMRDAVLRGAFEPVLGGNAASSTYVHADSVNSNLARSMRSNLDETIAAHGGMSITFSERARRGVDVLRETGAADVAFNKTEVCPYGNNCPRDVVKELKGLRRCALCPYAVRFIDHLPAVLAKKRQVAENVDELEKLLAIDAKTLNAKYSPEELDGLEDERARLCEDLSGWTLSEEVLEVMRHRIATGQDSRTWTVQKPEIIERDLRRVAVQTSASEYLLARLGESIAFPSLESPQVRARFDLLRRELLARAGNLRAAFATSVPADPAAECAGMLKALIDSTGMTISQLAKLLEHDGHMTDLPRTDLRLLTVEEES